MTLTHVGSKGNWLAPKVDLPNYTSMFGLGWRHQAYERKKKHEKSKAILCVLEYAL